jgi:DnaK suppressor protein
LCGVGGIAAFDPWEGRLRTHDGIDAVEMSLVYLRGNHGRDRSGEEMTSTSPYNLDMLRHALEKQYELHTVQLTTLAVDGHGPNNTSSDEYTRVALIASSRRALSEIAHALRRMAEGTYGVCERCEIAIPAERLEVLPHTRFCSTCRAAGR